jgi:uncharacterized protein (DUF736 family)
MEYDNTNRGTLYRNENKKEENHPDYSGSLNVSGKEFWLSGWVKESKKDGKKFFSLSIKPKAKENPHAKKQEKFVDDDLNDPIPF